MNKSKNEKRDKKNKQNKRNNSFKQRIKRTVEKILDSMYLW